MSEAAVKDQNAPKETIVIAEDSAPNRKILALLLAKNGYNVLQFEDGQQTWEELQKNTTDNIVAVISDVMMPNMDGLALLKSCRENDKYKSIPFVLVTAVSDKDYIMQAKELKVNGYILKPVTFQRVAAKLKELFPQKKFTNISG